MDDLDSNKFPRDEALDEPIPFDDDLDEPIPLDDEDTGEASVSHSPLNLGGGGAAEVPKPAAKQPVETAASGGRITGVKTFFTKLHPGAMEFLDEQINKWLKANPGVQIKLTNTTTGMVQAKKTEPNIIISVWY